MAHPRSATGNAEPGACNPRGSPSDPAHDHDLTRQAATAALGDASRVRSEPLETSTHHKAAEVFRRACCRTVLLIKDGLFEVVPGIYQVRGYDVSVKDGSIKRCKQLPGDASDLRKPGRTPRGTPGGYEGGDASSSPLTTGTCPRSAYGDRHMALERLIDKGGSHQPPTTGGGYRSRS